MPEPSLLFAGLVFGTLGVYVFKEGRRLTHVGKIILGIALIIYPYFVSSALLTWIIGTVLFLISFKI